MLPYFDSVLTQDYLNPCPMPINVDQYPGIDPKYLARHINADQSIMIGIDQHWGQCHNFDRH